MATLASKIKIDRHYLEGRPPGSLSSSLLTLGKNMHNYQVIKKFHLTQGRRLRSQKPITLLDFQSSMQMLASNIDIIKEYLNNPSSCDRAYIRKLPQLMAEEFGYTIFMIIDGLGMEGVNSNVIKEINVKYRSRLLKLATEEDVYQKLKAPKKYPNADTELLELFESAYALSQEVYDVIISH